MRERERERIVRSRVERVKRKKDERADIKADFADVMPWLHTIQHTHTIHSDENDNILEMSGRVNLVILSYPGLTHTRVVKLISAINLTWTELIIELKLDCPCVWNSV